MPASPEGGFPPLGSASFYPLPQPMSYPSCDDFPMRMNPVSRLIVPCFDSSAVAPPRLSDITAIHLASVSPARPPCLAHHATNQPAPLPQTRPKPMPNGLLLTNQAGLHRKNPPWTLVERVVRELDQGTGNSFCCLSASNNEYVQTLHGLNGYHLEWRVTGTGAAGHTHYRASYPGGSKKRTLLVKHDYVNSGQQRDLIHLEDVVDTFRAFHNRSSLPPWLEWRELDL